MGFFQHCVTNLHTEGTTLINAEVVPLLSADYDASQPFGYIMMVISGLLMLGCNIMFFKGFLFKPKQPFAWALLFWGNVVYLFQLALIIDNHVSRLVLILGELHDIPELRIAYWNYLTIRGYLQGPADTKVPENIRLGDRIVLWVYTILATMFVIGQLSTMVLLTPLRYGTYAFYLILVGDICFLGSSVISFIIQIRRKVRGVFLYEMCALAIVVVGHSIYALNSLLICYYPRPTAIVSIVTNFISIVGVVLSTYIVYKYRKSDHEALDYLPDSTFLWA